MLETPRISVVDNYFTTTLFPMHPRISFLMEILVVAYNQLTIALYLKKFIFHARKK